MLIDEDNISLIANINKNGCSQYQSHNVAKVKFSKFNVVENKMHNKVVNIIF